MTPVGTTRPRWPGVSGFYRIGEVSCPTKYFEEASSINFRRSVIYGVGVVKTAVQFRLNKAGFVSSPIFRRK